MLKEFLESEQAALEAQRKLAEKRERMFRQAGGKSAPAVSQALRDWLWDETNKSTSYDSVEVEEHVYSNPCQPRPSTINASQRNSTRFEAAKATQHKSAQPMAT